MASHDPEPICHSPQPPAEPREKPAAANDVFGRVNWLLFALGALLMAAGYWLMDLAGRDAADAAGRFSPMLVLGGLVVFGLGFAVKR